MKIFAVFFNIVYLKNTLAVINVARGSTGEYCDSIQLPEKLFDGKTSKDLVAAFTHKCPTHAYIKFQTKKHYYVHYFVVYRGEGPDTGQMSYIRTEIFAGYLYNFCGEHYLPTVPYDVGIRINCPPRLKSNWFQVVSHRNEGLYLSEVELNFIGNNPEEIWMLHRGCFKAFNGDMKDVNDIYDCAKKCMETLPYFAMKGSECYCGSDYKEEDLETTCDIKCNNSDLICGGQESFSVYLVNFRLPYYDGCFERTNLTVSSIEGDMSPGKCLQHCESEKLAMLSKGNKCQCSSDRGDSVMKREDCTTPCTGDATYMCGSQSDTMFSVWRECTNPETHSIKCSDGFKCDGMYNGFGICIGSCKSGYAEPHCFERAVPTTSVTVTDVTNVTDVTDVTDVIKNVEIWSKMYIILIVGVILVLCGIGFFVFRTATLGSASSSD